MMNEDSREEREEREERNDSFMVNMFIMDDYDGPLTPDQRQQRWDEQE